MRYDTRHHPIHATPTLGGARRGSTIIVAVGVLAVLALVAVSYAVVVRADRAGAAAYERGVDLQTSARVVRDEIGALLAADLFGNKIVTPDVPFQARVGPDDVRVWPRMFEDGEFFDVPQTAPGAFDTRDPDEQQTAAIIETDPWVIPLFRNAPGIGSFFPSAPYRDDAWLANTEPVNPNAPTPRNGANHLQWTTWGQLTNLRSAYRHFRMNNSDLVGLWVRDDGRYADLGQFFLSDFADRYSRGDPGANLSFAERTNGLDEFTGLLNGPRIGLSSTSIGNPAIPYATDVFGFQIHQLDELHRRVPANTPLYSNADERFFTDTDGDLRPDARWQVLDALDGLLGLRWVVAARIVDNSALVNVNTAMEFQDPANATIVGDGRTPADVDLTRLMRTAHLAPDLQTLSPWSDPQAPGYTLRLFDPGSSSSNYFPARIDSTLLNPINQHMIEQLSLDRFTSTVVDFTVAPYAPLELLWSWDGSATPATMFTNQDIILGLNGNDPPPQHTTRLQRYITNRYFGVSPLQPTTERIAPYTIADEAEIRSFFGLNNGATISKIEQRFDFTRLDDSSGLLSGPMRTKENINTARNLALNTANVAEILPSTLAIASDTRRHLTTVSGVGDFSPVPVLNATMVNERPIFERPFNTKLSFTDIPRYTPDPTDVGTVNEARYQRDRLRREELVRAAFDSFAWALAPLAGHMPLMSPLTTDHTGAQLATQTNPARFFYGGDTDTTRGPAFSLNADMIAGGASATDPGAAYAILRAASLAVNLFDATDDDRIDPDNPPTAPTGATQDMPTVARLYNITHPEPYNIDPTANDPTRFAAGIAAPPTLPFPPTVPTDGVVRMGVGFSWGDLRAAAGAGQVVDPRIENSASSDVLLPEAYVGAPLNGVTLVGLDRQPFLREVSTVAVYADSLALVGNPNSSQMSAADETIDSADDRERIGSIVTWEVGNPWAQAINIENYRLAIADSDIDYLTFDWPAPSISTIPPGGRVVFYAIHWKDGDSAAAFFMQNYETTWRAEMEMRIDANDLRPVSGSLGVRGLLDATAAQPTDGVPFQNWAPGDAVGLIMIDDDVSSPGRGIPGAGRLVVDRIAHGPNGGIPVVLNGSLGLDSSIATPPAKVTGVLSTVGTVHRATQTVDPGFPAWVIERRSANDGVEIQASSGSPLLAEWAVSTGGSSGFGSDPGEVASSQGEAVVGEVPTLGEEDKGAFTLAAGDLPSFQLFVPNTELRYASEILQLSAFTHMYVHAGLDADGAVLGPDIADPTRFGPGTWRTISEQLGSDGEIYRDAPNNTLVNPYIGVLDPTRFVLASSAAPNATTVVGTLGPIVATPREGLPEALAVPLALRVVDVIEPLWTPDWRGGSRLVQGRVNINTAAQKTLRMLPLVDPQDPIGTLASQAGSPATDWRVPQLMAYRDRWADPLGGVGDDPAAITGLLGFNDSALRFVDQNAEQGMFTLGGDPLSRGFVTPGELAILGRWDAGNPANPGTGPDGALSFLGLGADAAAITDTAVNSLDVRKEANVGTGDVTIRPTPLGGGALDAFEGVDDVEERLAIYRAVSNIVTARSDVYTAYFKVRGYAPRDIEAVTITPNPDDTLIGQYLDELQPRFEARFLAVYDRSTVRTPVDRPKVLLFVRLPD